MSLGVLKRNVRCLGWLRGPEAGPMRFTYLFISTFGFASGWVDFLQSVVFVGRRDKKNG